MEFSEVMAAIEFTAGRAGRLHHPATLYDPDGRATAHNRQLVVVYDRQ